MRRCPLFRWWRNRFAPALQRCKHVIMRHHSHHRRAGRAGGWQQADQPDASDAADWFAGRMPEHWFTGDPEVTVDREEITVVGRLPEVDGDSGETEAHASGRAARFREQTRAERMQIADEAEARYRRKVAWGVDAGVARSRSDALAWSVRLVGEHADEWLGKLRAAMREVDDLRAQGPSV